MVGRTEKVKMIILQYIYRDIPIKTEKIDMEFNRKNCEYVEMLVNKRMLEVPKVYDKFELHEEAG